MATLLAPNGRRAISLRIGEPDAERSMYPASLPEVVSFAQKFGLQLIRQYGQARSVCRFLDHRSIGSARRRHRRPALATPSDPRRWQFVDLKDRAAAHPRQNRGHRSWQREA